MKEKIVEDPPGALPAGEEPRDRIMLLYQSVDTNVGSDLYGHVTCLRQDRKDGGWRTHRKSSPFVVARRYGGREVVPGERLPAREELRRSVCRHGRIDPTGHAAAGEDEGD